MFDEEWLSRFHDFLLEKLAEYQAQEAVAPCCETRERIDLVQQMLESCLSLEKSAAKTSEAFQFVAPPTPLLQ